MFSSIGSCPLPCQRDFGTRITLSLKEPPPPPAAAAATTTTTIKSTATAAARTKGRAKGRQDHRKRFRRSRAHIAALHAAAFATHFSQDYEDPALKQSRTSRDYNIFQVNLAEAIAKEVARQVAEIECAGLSLLEAYQRAIAMYHSKASMTLRDVAVNMHAELLPATAAMPGDGEGEGDGARDTELTPELQTVIAQQSRLLGVDLHQHTQSMRVYLRLHNLWSRKCYVYSVLIVYVTYRPFYFGSDLSIPGIPLLAFYYILPYH